MATKACRTRTASSHYSSHPVRQLLKAVAHADRLILLDENRNLRVEIVQSNADKARLLFLNGMLRHELAIRYEELAVFTEEPARIEHPDDDWN